MSSAIASRRVFPAAVFLDQIHRLTLDYQNPLGRSLMNSLQRKATAMSASISGHCFGAAQEREEDTRLGTPLIEGLSAGGDEIVTVVMVFHIGFRFTLTANKNY